MTAPVFTVEVDGRTFRVGFAGFGVPLAVEGGPTLSPWTFAEHLEALDRHLVIADGTADLDVDGFCADVLARDGVSGPDGERLAPLALWWVAGGEPASTVADADGWIDLGTARVRLRPWTYAERARALAAAPGGSVHITRYLSAMIAASAVAWLPADVEVGALDAAATATLLAAVTACNHPDGGIEEELAELDGGGAEAARLLRLCAILHWTPSQVWNAPAAEIARLERLIALAEPAAPPRRTSSVADHPDAIVIRFDDDGGAP